MATSITVAAFSVACRALWAVCVLISACFRVVLYVLVCVCASCWFFVRPFWHKHRQFTDRMPPRRFRASLLHEVDPVSRLEAERAALRAAQQEASAKLRLARKRKAYSEECLMRGLSSARWALVAYVCILSNMSTAAAEKYCEMWAYNDPERRAQARPTTGVDIRDRLGSHGVTTVVALQQALGPATAVRRALLRAALFVAE